MGTADFIQVREEEGAHSSGKIAVKTHVYLANTVIRE